MTIAIEQIKDFFDKKRFTENQENRFLSKLISIEGCLLKSQVVHFHPEIERQFGCYFELDEGTLPEVVDDGPSGDLKLKAPVLYRKGHRAIDVYFSVNDNLLYVHISDEEGDIEILDDFGGVSKKFIEYLCCE